MGRGVALLGQVDTQGTWVPGCRWTGGCERGQARLGLGGWGFSTRPQPPVSSKESMLRAPTGGSGRTWSWAGQLGLPTLAHRACLGGSQQGWVRAAGAVPRAGGRRVLLRWPLNPGSPSCWEQCSSCLASPFRERLTHAECRGGTRGPAAGAGGGLCLVLASHLGGDPLGPHSAEPGRAELTAAPRPSGLGLGLPLGSRRGLPCPAGLRGTP